MARNHGGLYVNPLGLAVKGAAAYDGRLRTPPNLLLSASVLRTMVLLGIVLAITAIIRLAGRGVEKLSKNRLAAGGQ